MDSTTNLTLRITDEQNARFLQISNLPEYNGKQNAMDRLFLFMITEKLGIKSPMNKCQLTSLGNIYTCIKNITSSFSTYLNNNTSVKSDILLSDISKKVEIYSNAENYAHDNAKLSEDYNKCVLEKAGLQEQMKEIIDSVNSTLTVGSDEGLNKVGRKRIVTPTHITLMKTWKSQGKSVGEIAGLLSVSIETVRKYWK